MTTYDIGIIGAGPAGYVAAERAGQKGLKTVLFNKDKLGGVCLNTGCIPTKTLLYTAKRFDYAKNSEKYGINVENAAYDFEKIMKRKDKVIKKLVGGIAAMMKKHNVEVVNDHAEIKEKQKGHIIIQAGENDFTCKNIMIATGSEAFIPPIKGMDKKKIWTNEEILEAKEVPKSLAIIGAGFIGMEFASIFSVLGSEVTVIEMMDEVLPGIDPELSSILRKEMEKSGITFHLNAKVTEARGKKIIFEKDKDTQDITADELLVSVGRKPVVDGFGIEKLGIEYDKKGINIDEQCRTNIPNVYAAGDVTGYSLLAHTASREGEVVINNITGKKDVMRYNAVPGVVYTHPEIATVGLTEKEAQEQNIPYNVKTLPMAYAGRYVAENEGGKGIAKILTGKKYGEILGVHMIGDPASEIIHSAALMIESEMRLKDIEQVIFPHPTVSEIIKETVVAFNEK